MKSFTLTHLSRWFLLAAYITLPPVLSAASVLVEDISPGGYLNNGDATKVVTSGDSVFTAWIEGDPPNAVLKVGRIDGDGSQISTTVRTGIMNDEFHVMPSIAIDKDGYIHVTADMHYHDWVYYISDAPYDVSSFTQYAFGNPRCPPGRAITYPEFTTDTNGELYLAFRMHISSAPPYPYGSDPGNIGGGLARYDMETQTWTWIGGLGTDPAFPSGAGDESPTLFWHSSGSLGGWYQQPTVRVFFDSSNRMHAIGTLGVTEVPRTWNGATHLLYAYSDDGGVTFHKVDGSPISSLPLTVDNATVIVDRTAQADLETSARIGAFAPDAPVVSVNYGGARYSYKWDSSGASWVAVTPPDVMAGVYTRRNGEGIYLRPYNGVYRTLDGGDTFELINHGLSYAHGSESIDYDFYIKTGHVRWQRIGNTSHDVSIVTLYSGPVPPVVPMVTLVMASGSDPQLSFTTQSGFTYQLQKSTTDLGPGSFSDVAGQSVTGEDGVEKSLSDPAGNPAPGNAVFYRISVN
jgi:hypothetical protein